ncbi:MAG: NosD domain-containing protein [Infirmifilum sp.]
MKLRRAFSVAMVLVLLLQALQVHVARGGRAIVVPDDYPTIQKAVDAAAPGDTVYVKAGRYRENIVINKPIRLVGENPATTIIDGGGAGTVLTIKSSNLHITGFTIQNGRSAWVEELGAGILITNAKNCNISGNNIANNDDGIYLYGSSSNSIYHNNFVDNGRQVYSEESANVWDDGYPSGGNYWSDYRCVDEKSGPAQDQPGRDGICDKPYIIGKDNVDHYPLAKPYQPPPLNVELVNPSPPDGAKAEPPITFRVRVTSGGQPVQDALVTFYMGDGGASYNRSDVRTDSNGYAEVKDWDPKWDHEVTFTWWVEASKEGHKSGVSEKRTLTYTPGTVYKLRLPLELFLLLIAALPIGLAALLGRRGRRKPRREKVCPRCGAPVDPYPKAKYCWRCGARLEEHEDRKVY